MRTLMLALPLLVTGCSNQALCSALLGTFEGTFGGQLQGTLQAVISQDKNKDDQATAQFTLDAVDATLEGDGPVYCEDGSLVLDLRNLDGDGSSIGQVNGNADGQSASGDYALDSGETGDWEY